jgi:poly(A) polymerase
MIKKFIQRVFGKDKKSSDPKKTKPKILKVSEHGIKRDMISACALRTTSQLQQAGYQAYVVGGAVRDLLTGRMPKDFDVATDATPDQVRAAIRRSRIIGRRFQIVHALCGNETVEVSTFRAMSVPIAEGENDSNEMRADEHGRLLRDNVFGNQEEDASRRDFTANALFYDPATEELWDYHHGVADIRAKKLRMIGDPATRYREDPVRMLRAARFAAKLGFTIDGPTQKPIREMADLLKNVPKSRLFDEMMKLLLSGHAWACVTTLRTEGLHHGLLPLLDVILEQPMGERFVKLALEQTDLRIQQDKTISPGFLFATLLWHEVLAAWDANLKAGMRKPLALHQAMDDVLRQQSTELNIPRRYDAVMNEIWQLQPRFIDRSGSKPFRLLSHPRFRAGYDFLLLRCQSGELDAELGQWWETFQAAGEEERQSMLLTEIVEPGTKKRRRRKRKAPAAGPVDAE